MSPVLEEGIAGQETYQALLRLYTLALERAVHMPEANFSWVSLSTLFVVILHSILTLFSGNEYNILKKKIANSGEPS